MKISAMLATSLLLGTLLAACGDDGADPDPCEGITCSDHGGCVPVGGVARCLCEAGYGGTDCEACAEGYVDDGAGSCVLGDRCQAASCSFRGDCDDSTGAVLCDCDAGYAGAACESCAAGYHLEEAACAEDASCLATTCSGHGTCDDAQGVPRCDCDPGYEGGACDACAEGYQDHDGDGDCAQDCTTAELAGLVCGAYADCADLTGTAACACLEGFQDHDGDGDCAPSCELREALGTFCDASTECDDSSGEAECVCEAPLVDEDGQCVLPDGLPPNGDFLTYDAWTTLEGATLLPAGTGYLETGSAFIDEAAYCDEGGIVQSFAMPELPPGPATLSAWIQGKSIFMGICEADAELSVNGRYRFIGTSGSAWTHHSFCLGDGAFGGTLELGLRARSTCFYCDSEPLPTTEIPTLRIDNVEIRQTTEGSCPDPGEVLNGAFYAGFEGWMASAGGNATVEVLPSGGEWGGPGAHLVARERCSGAYLTGKVSVPATAISSPALSLWHRGTAGTTARLMVNGSFFAKIAGTGAPTTTRICLPEGVRGTVFDLDIASQGFGSGLCSDPVSWDYLIDSLALVSDPSCEDPAILHEGTFELPATAARSAWTTEVGNSGGGAVTFLTDPAQAHTGSGSLELRINGNCTGPIASTLVTPPPADATGGPAVIFWYRYPVKTYTTFRVALEGPGDWLTIGPPAPAASWTQVITCLEPRWAGRVSRLSFIMDGGSGFCSPGQPNEYAYVDDVEIVNHPSCP